MEHRATQTSVFNDIWFEDEVTGTTIDLRYLSNGQSYTVRVWSVNADGRSKMAAEATAVPNPPEPPPPGKRSGSPVRHAT